MKWLIDAIILIAGIGLGLVLGIGWLVSNQLNILRGVFK